MNCTSFKKITIVECIKVYFGKNCSHQCSVNCYMVYSCDRYTGQCEEGCKPGWTGDTCTLGILF